MFKQLKARRRSEIYHYLFTHVEYLFYVLWDFIHERHRNLSLNNSWTQMIMQKLKLPITRDVWDSNDCKNEPSSIRPCLLQCSTHNGTENGQRLTCSILYLLDESRILILLRGLKQTWALDYRSMIISLLNNTKHLHFHFQSCSLPSKPSSFSHQGFFHTPVNRLWLHHAFILRSTHAICWTHLIFCLQITFLF